MIKSQWLPLKCACTGMWQSISYLASVTLKGGKVFALFVKTPTKTFAADEAKLRSLVASFKTV